MGKKTVPQMISGPLDCACVIHGNKYDWNYVERLHAMLRRNLLCDINFHVFTEANRSVPPHMTKHVLTEWPGVSGPKKSWWYKMQMFDPSRIGRQTLYLDLDVVVVDDLNWICELDTRYFWAIRDWRYMWKPLWRGLNSSVLYWDSKRFSKVWIEFCSRDLTDTVRRYHGDQDFINEIVAEKERQFFRDEYVLSWRWQIKDGGLDPRTRSYRNPGQGSMLVPGAKILVFHGSPKPHEIQDPVIEKLWID